MPLVPITDQERKRMMNELAEIDELKNQLQWKKDMILHRDIDIREYHILHHNCYENIWKCEKVINVMTHNTREDIEHKLKEGMEEISRMEKMLSESMAKRTNLFREISEMENIIKQSQSLFN